MRIDESAGHEHCCEARAGRTAAWVDIATLVLLAAFLVYSFLGNRIRFFVASYYVWLPLPTAVLLLAMAAARVQSIRRRPLAGCGCGDGAPRTSRRLLCMAILLAAVAAVLVVSPTSYSSEWLRKRASGGPPRDPRLNQAINWVLGIKTQERKKASGSFQLPKDPTVVDLVNAANRGYRDDLEGKFVSMIGQCDEAGSPAARGFGMYRLVVTCCIADAVVVSLEVRSSANVKLDSGGWVRVAGILQFDNEMDPTQPVVHATTVTRIPEPNQPYL